MTTKFDLPEEAAIQFDAALQNRNFDELRDLVYMHLGNLELNYTNVPDIFPGKRLNFPMARKWLDEQMLNKPLADYLPKKAVAPAKIKKVTVDFKMDADRARLWDRNLSYWGGLPLLVLCLITSFFDIWVAGAFIGTIVISIASVVIDSSVAWPKSRVDWGNWIERNGFELAAVGLILFGTLNSSLFFGVALLYALQAFKNYLKS